MKVRITNMRLNKTKLGQSAQNIYHFGINIVYGHDTAL